MAADPILSKLFSLWELDESSLSDFSLHPSIDIIDYNIYDPSKLSASRYPCYSDSDAPFGSTLGNDSTSMQVAQSVVQEPRARVPLCEQCGHPNQDSANWCIECGTAMIGVSPLSLNNSLLLCESRSGSASSSSTASSPQLCENSVDDDNFSAELEYTSLPLCDILTHEKNRSFIHSRSTSDNDVYQSAMVCNDRTVHEKMNVSAQEPPKSLNVMSSQPSLNQHNSYRCATVDSRCSSPSPSPECTHTRKDYQRHWSTSGVYMWRKPSSIQRPTVARRSLSEDSNLYVHSPADHCDFNLVSIKQTESDADLLCSTPTSVTRVHKDQRSLILDMASHHTAPLLMCLPDEVILMVLSNLEQKDLVNCMLVCRRLFHIASDATLWRCVKLERCTNVCEKTLMNMAKKRPTSISLLSSRGTVKQEAMHKLFKGVANTLKVLNVTLCDFGTKSGDMVFLSAALHCPKLSSITFNWCNLSESVVVKGFKAFSSLEDVSLEQQGSAFGNEAVQALIKKHRQTLRKLDVGSFDSTVVMALCWNQKLPNLTSFSGTFTKVDVNTFKTIAFVFPRLKELTVRQYTETTLDEEVTKELSNNLESLSLKLSNPCALSHASCTHINQLTNLRSLVLDCINDEALQTLCVGKLKLRFLDLSQSSVTDKSFTLIGGSSFASTLSHVRMSKCHGIDASCSRRMMRTLKEGSLHEGTLQQQLLEFIQQCEKLSVIDLSWLYCVKDLNLEKFRPCRILIKHP